MAPPPSVPHQDPWGALTEPHGNATPVTLQHMPTPWLALPQTALLDSRRAAQPAQFGDAPPGSASNSPGRSPVSSPPSRSCQLRLRLRSVPRASLASPCCPVQAQALVPSQKLCTPREALDHNRLYIPPSEDFGARWPKALQVGLPLQEKSRLRTENPNGKEPPGHLDHSPVHSLVSAPPPPRRTP